MDMKPRLHDWQTMNFSLSGTCPHCHDKSVFYKTGGVDSQQTRKMADGDTANQFRIAAIMKCAGCSEHILCIAIVKLPIGTQGEIFCEAYYPVSKPQNTVSEDVPKDIADDFLEAQRCRWVDSYNATVEMCRRALETSCLQLGADPKLGTLEKMIDWVHGKGLITVSLKEMAHKIRLGGDRGAHPSSRVMGEQDADAVLEFTTEYIDHVYVMPAKLAKFDFSRPKPLKADAAAADVPEGEK